MIKHFRHLTEWLKTLLPVERPPIYCLQVEVTTLCQLSCIYCPRSVLRNRWTETLLDLEIFKKQILPCLDSFEMVFLQGWGEPLLHPHFWEMAYLVKQQGKKVGFATNGIALSATSIETACKLNIDVISFTFAGATEKTHEMYRKGASFAQLTDRVKQLAFTKDKLGANDLQIGISYTVMRRNLSELPFVIELAAELGANYVTASHMDCIPELSLEQEAVYLQHRPEDESILIRTAAKAKKYGITFKSECAQQLGELLVCEPHPFYTNVYVTADGRVVPCHIMGLPLYSTDQTFFRGRAYPYNPIVFGNVNNQSLHVLLDNKAALEVQDIFRGRLNASLTSASGIKPVPEFCRSCYKLHGV